MNPQIFKFWGSRTKVILQLLRLKAFIRCRIVKVLARIRLSFWKLGRSITETDRWTSQWIFDTTLMSCPIYRRKIGQGKKFGGGWFEFLIVTHDMDMPPASVFSILFCSLFLLPSNRLGWGRHSISLYSIKHYPNSRLFFPLLLPVLLPAPLMGDVVGSCESDCVELNCLLSLNHYKNLSQQLFL